MIYRAENDEKRATFIARLETQDLFKLLEKCSLLNNDEIDNQITALEISSNQLTGTTTY